MRKQMNCINCGSKNHLKKDCSEPIHSIGIILIKIKSPDIYLINKLIDNLELPEIKSTKDLNLEIMNKESSDKEIIDKLINNLKISKLDNNVVNVSANSIDAHTEENLNTFWKLNNSIKFLVVQRKHSLGYYKFIRGDYEINNPEGIQFLFKQMIQKEINKIGLMTFDELWADLWSKEKAYKNHEYNKSKTLFNMLTITTKYNNLQFYVNNVIPTWSSNEWGFPKGRKSFGENDLNCGIREFKEETGFTDDEFIVLDKILPIEETFCGTDGIKYKHSYFLAVSLTSKEPEIDKNAPLQFNEISNIKWMNYDQLIKEIRPYHSQRIHMISETFMYIINYIANL